MNEIINIIILGFSLFTTPYGLVAWIILLILFACYLFLFCGRKITIAKIIMLMMYPFLFIIGAFLCILAELTENNLMQTTGACILLMPILLKICVFGISKLRKKPKKQKDIEVVKKSPDSLK